MALQPQYIDIPLGFHGQETRVDPKVVEAPQLLELINGEIVRPGAISKRHGYTFLEASANLANPVGNGTRANQAGALIGIGPAGVAEWSAAQNTWKNNSAGMIAACESKVVDASPFYNYDVLDIGYSTYIYVLVKLTEASAGTYDGVWCYIYDKDTLQLLNSYKLDHETYPANRYNGQLIIIGNTILAIYTHDNGEAFNLVSCPLTLSGHGTPVLLIENLVYKDHEIFDVSQEESYGWIACNVNLDGTIRVRILKINSASAILKSYDYGNHKADLALTIVRHESLTQVLLVVANSVSGVHWAILDPALPSGSVILYASAGAIAAGEAIEQVTACSSKINYTGAIGWVFFYRYEPETEPDVLKWYFLTSAGVEDEGKSQIDAFIATKPKRLLDTRGPTMIVGRVQDVNSVYYAVQLKDGTDGDYLEPVAKFRYGMEVGYASLGISLLHGIPELILIGSEYWFAATCRVQIDSNSIGVDFVEALCIGRFSLDLEKSLLSVNAQDKVYIAAGMPLEFDGKTYREIGFTHPPKIISIDQGGGEVPTVPTGTYIYIAIYEITDRYGNIYKSQLSDPFIFENPSLCEYISVKLTGAINRIFTGFFANAPTIALYRTTGEGGTSGTIFYRTNTRAKVPDECWWDEVGEFHDSTIDADLIKNELLYTTGGLLERCAPPSTECLEIHQRRLWGVDTENGNIFYSGEFCEGEGPWFNPVQTISTDDTMDRPLALVSLNQSLAVFWRNKIGLVYGEGPNAQGQGGTYTSPQIIANKIGLIDQRSLVKIPGGYMFKGAEGFHLFNGQTPQYIGGGVYDYNGLTVVSAVTIPDKHQARFLVCGTLNDHSVKLVLVYDWEFNQWGVWGNYSTDHIHSLGGSTAYGGTVISNVHYLSANNGNTLVQGAHYYDEISPTTDTYYPVVVGMPWIKLAGLQGYQRIWWAYLLGEYKSEHALTIYIDYNYKTLETDTIVISKADIVAKYSKLYQIKIGIPKQRCESIHFRFIIDTSGATAPDGAGAEINGLRLEYGIKGTMRLPHFALV